MKAASLQRPRSAQVHEPSALRHLVGPGGLVLVLAILVLIATRLPLGSALEFGKDEGFEVMKAFLCSKGFVLYKQIWNDQPPVHTMLLTWWFKMWGPTILSARVLAVGFGLLLFGSFYQLVRQRSSTLCALVSSFLLLASPLVLMLSVSVMLEVPAIGTAMASALFVQPWRRRPHWAWLVGSGVLLGVALQIKLTAAVVAPAILAEMVMATGKTPGEGWRRAGLVRLLPWMAAVGVTFVIIGATLGAGSLESSLKSHLTIGDGEGFAQGPESFPVQLALFGHHFECIVGAVVAVVWAVRRKRVAELTFPIVLLCTLVVIHGLHRPWWNYYYLHFAVPLAWLCGWSVSRALEAAVGYVRTKRLALSSIEVWNLLVCCVFAAGTLARSETRLETGLKQLRESPRSNMSALLAKMRRYATGTHWVCASDAMYAFQAQLSVPPELAVVMAKRFWSGQISAAQIVKVCRKYKPEQVLLPNGRISADWRDFLNPDYELVYADREFVLYVSKSVVAAGSRKLKAHV